MIDAMRDDDVLDPSLSADLPIAATIFPRLRRPVSISAAPV
jgi:hypothetical protein